MVKLFGVDAIRYFMIHEMPYENDGILSWDLFSWKNQSILSQYTWKSGEENSFHVNKMDGIVENKGVGLRNRWRIQKCDYRNKGKVEARWIPIADALTEVMNLFKRCNKYIDETEPWVLAKDSDKSDRLKTVLYNLTEGINIGATFKELYAWDIWEDYVTDK